MIAVALEASPDFDPPRIDLTTFRIDPLLPKELVDCDSSEAATVAAASVVAVGVACIKGPKVKGVNFIPSFKFDNDNDDDGNSNDEEAGLLTPFSMAPDSLS